MRDHNDLLEIVRRHREQVRLLEYDKIELEKKLREEQEVTRQLRQELRDALFQLERAQGRA